VKSTTHSRSGAAREVASPGRRPLLGRSHGGPRFFTRGAPAQPTCDQPSTVHRARDALAVQLVQTFSSYRSRLSYRRAGSPFRASVVHRLWRRACPDRSIRAMPRLRSAAVADRVTGPGLDEAPGPGGQPPEKEILPSIRTARTVRAWKVWDQLNARACARPVHRRAADAQAGAARVRRGGWKKPRTTVATVPAEAGRPGEPRLRAAPRRPACGWWTSPSRHPGRTAYTAFVIDAFARLIPGGAPRRATIPACADRLDASPTAPQA